MKSHLFRAVALCAFGLLSPQVYAADHANPFKKIDVGDWVSFKSVETTNAVSNDGKLKLTVSSKKDEKVILAVAIQSLGQTIPGQDLPIDLSKPYDPTEMWPLPQGPGVVIGDVKYGDTGKETITVGKTKYECKWTTQSVTIKAPAKNAEVTYDYKIWTSPDAPLGGLVKMEVQFGHTSRTILLEDSGKSK